MGLQVKKDHLRDLVSKWVNAEASDVNEIDDYTDHSSGFGIGATPSKTQKAPTNVVEKVLKRKLNNQQSEEEATLFERKKVDEEDEEESKFSLKQNNKIQKTGASFIESLQDTDNQNKKKKKKKKKKASNATPTDSKATADSSNTSTTSTPVTPIPVESKVETPIEPATNNVAKNTNFQKNKNQEREEKTTDKTNNSGGYINHSGTATKRTVKVKYVQDANGTMKKKTKTRSKQKNIRRDSRPQKAKEGNQEGEEKSTEEKSTSTNVEEVTFKDSDFASNWD